MALSGSAMPRACFATPRKIGAVRTDPEPFTTPKIHKTPRLQAASSTNTPECFSAVSLETPNPVSARRRSSNKDKFDQVSNLTVAVRIRPMNKKELACQGSANIVRVRDQEVIIRSSPVGTSAMGIDHIFQYDHVFWSCDEASSLYVSQEDVFLTIGKPLLNNAFRGYNACLFAYGQTGSGKSYSMMGKNTSDVIDIDTDDSGITPRFCQNVFDRISILPPGSTATVEVSYFEIYNEKIHDLLSTQTTGGANSKMPLKVREHPEWGPYVVDLSVHAVSSYEELRNWLLLGNKNRATAATNMNEKSSRSHSIFTIELCLLDSSSEEDTSRRSKVSLVDLAGSERLGGSHNSEEKIRQGVSINKSLLTLGKVISALADLKKSQFVPYRDSVLTWLLRESLGGNSLTSMLATITPASSNLDETLATLRYACQARSIINRARINENPHDRLIRELKSEVERLRALKQDYERSSLISNSSLNQMNDSASREEMEALRNKLLAAETKLETAEKSWKQRFMECAHAQLKELAESEKRREVLESKVRVMKTIDRNVTLSPYKTNFLEKLEDVLTEQHTAEIMTNAVIEWCCVNDLHCAVSFGTLTITDTVNKKQAFVSLNDARSQSGKDIGEFIKSLTWTEIKQAKGKKLSKSEITSSLNSIYEMLNRLQPAEGENQLNLLFARVNKSLQSFETALLSSVAKSNGSKAVTFNL